MKILLVIIILSGIRFNYFDWKNLYFSYVRLLERIKRGFHPEDFIIPDCHCGNCKPLTNDEKEEKAKDIYIESITNEREVIVSQIAYSIFNTSIVIIALIQYINLI